MSFTESLGLVNHSIDYVQPYINDHVIKIYVDVDKFRVAIGELSQAIRSIVMSHINDAVLGFNTRARNMSADYSFSTEEESTAFSNEIADLSNKLSAAAQSVVDKADALVQDHVLNRPLLRETGNRKSLSKINVDGITTFSYEFQNVGKKTWTGWMNITVTDEYKNKIITDFVPATIITIEPGDSAWLSREVKVPRVLYTTSGPRSWGKKTKSQASINTRGV